ncbi:MAG: hypothetical protein KAQ87_01845 [Candidatus Pacebacteria bacterium]|nr:hypothetical protein [Candidatus Paceibacterota bacterium]
MIFLVLLFLFFVVLIIIGLTTNRSGERSETGRPSVFSSLTSKLPSAGTILVILVVAVISLATIIWALQFLFGFFTFAESQTPECFNNETNKDYGYSRINDGKFVIEDGKLSVFKSIRITSTNIIWEYPEFGFSIGGIEGRKGERVTVDVLLESRTGSCSFNFTVGPSAGVKKVKFSISENDQVLVRVDNSPIPIGEKRFNSSGSYDLTVDITSNKLDETAETRKSCSLFIPSFYLTEATFG